MSTVLVADDSPAFREMVADLLREIGVSVVLASDGQDATEKIKTSVPDLVVTDIVMPKMNGYELCRWIKKGPNTQHVPVIMCSTKSEMFDTQWGLRQGADAYITKPLQPKELLDTVKQLLRQKR